MTSRRQIPDCAHSTLQGQSTVTTSEEEDKDGLADHP